MKLSPGTTIGPYQVLGPLGAGGMGEVYEAEDGRLGRRVAVKVLPAHAESDPDRQRRFEVEARAAGSLNHPSVLSVFDVGTHEGAPYIVSELLEGCVLRDKLDGRPLPVRKAVAIALQVAEGLAAAHAKGIIHRDLKPENVFVTRDGRAKILDFGLAKAQLPGAASSGPIARTLPDGTAPGAIFGTAGYMSPEQVRGQPSDERSDLFSFGAILYEMLSGRRAFEAPSALEKGYATLKEEPPPLPDALAVPLALERITRRCLEKEPDARFQSASDLAFALQALSDAGSGPQAVPAVARRRPAIRASVLAAAALAATAGAAYLVGAGRAAAPRGPAATPAAAAQPPTPAPIVRFERLTFRRGAIGNAQFAPDGKSVYFTARFGDEPSRVYSTILGSPEARPVSESHVGLFSLSSQGEMALGLRPAEPTYHGLILARAPIAGGAPRALLENVVAADWSPAGDELAIVRVTAQGKRRLEYPIGKVLYETDGSITHVQVAPTGDRLVIAEHPVAFDTRGSVVLVEADGTRRTLSGPWPDLRSAAWSPDGREIWFTASKSGLTDALHAVPVTGGPERDLLETPGTVVIVDVTPQGRVLLRRDEFRFRISALRDGEPPQDLSWFDGSSAVDLSRDGRTLLFIEGLGTIGQEIVTYVRPTDGGPAVRLGEGWAWALSPDGQWAALSPRYPYDRLALVPTGPGETRPLPPGPIVEYRGARFFPDGKRLLIVGRDASSKAGVWIQDLAGGDPRPLGVEVLGEVSDPISPDGRRLVLLGEAKRVIVVEVEGGRVTPVEGLPEQHFPVAWTADGKGLLVRKIDREQQRTVPLLRFDLATRKLEPWREIPRPESGSNLKILLARPDEPSFILSYSSELGDLYVVDGLR